MTIQFNIPTNITLLRIALIPLLVVVFYLPWHYANVASVLIFITAGITDWLDGYLARKMQLETPFGAFLDPVAAAIIIGREITIASLREWMAEIGQRATVKVSELGKWKTTAQMLSIGLLLYRDDFLGLPINAIGYGLLYIAATLTLWSMISYLRAAFTAMAEK